MLTGAPALLPDRGETPLAPGMCLGFKAGAGDAHQLINRTDTEVVYLEVGDRSAGDSVRCSPTWTALRTDPGPRVGEHQPPRRNPPGGYGADCRPLSTMTGGKSNSSSGGRRPTLPLTWRWSPTVGAWLGLTMLIRRSSPESV